MENLPIMIQIRSDKYDNITIYQYELPMVIIDYIFFPIWGIPTPSRATLRRLAVCCSHITWAPSFMTVPGQRTPGWCEAFQKWYSNRIFKKKISKLQNEDVTYVTGALLRFLFGKSVSRWFLIASCSLPGEISRPPGASATLAFHVSGPRRCSGDRGRNIHGQLMGKWWENDDVAAMGTFANRRSSVFSTSGNCWCCSQKHGKNMWMCQEIRMLLIRWHAEWKIFA